MSNRPNNLDERLSKIKLDPVEKPAQAFLDALKKINRPLTKLEEKILRLMEDFFLENYNSSPYSVYERRSNNDNNKRNNNDEKSVIDLFSPPKKIQKISQFLT